MDAVTINMAKNQNIALNPNKINGCCGRLLCCLVYEDDNYTECRRNMPEVGQRIKDGIVRSVDILNRTYKLETDKEVKEIKLDNDKSSK